MRCPMVLFIGIGRAAALDAVAPAISRWDVAASLCLAALAAVMDQKGNQAN